MVKTSPGLFPRPCPSLLSQSHTKAMPTCRTVVMPMSMTYAKVMPRAMAMARVTVKVRTSPWHKPWDEAISVAKAGRVWAKFSGAMINKFTCLRELA